MQLRPFSEHGVRTAGGNVAFGAAAEAEGRQGGARKSEDHQARLLGTGEIRKTELAEVQDIQYPGFETRETVAEAIQVGVAAGREIGGTGEDTADQTEESARAV